MSPDCLSMSIHSWLGRKTPDFHCLSMSIHSRLSRKTPDFHRGNYEYFAFPVFPCFTVFKLIIIACIVLIFLLGGAGSDSRKHASKTGTVLYFPERYFKSIYKGRQSSCWHLQYELLPFAVFSQRQHICVNNYFKILAHNVAQSTLDISADCKFIFYFSQKIRADTSCMLSSKVIICWKCWILFSGKNKNKSSQIFT